MCVCVSVCVCVRERERERERERSSVKGEVPDVQSSMYYKKKLSKIMVLIERDREKWMESNFNEN